jgi:hypothetical protein
VAILEEIAKGSEAQGFCAHVANGVEIKNKWILTSYKHSHTYILFNNPSTQKPAMQEEWPACRKTGRAARRLAWLQKTGWPQEY